jgi:hypothetical protein
MMRRIMTQGHSEVEPADDILFFDTLLEKPISRSYNYIRQALYFLGFDVGCIHLRVFHIHDLPGGSVFLSYMWRGGL